MVRVYVSRTSVFEKHFLSGVEIPSSVPNVDFGPRRVLESKFLNYFVERVHFMDLYVNNAKVPSTAPSVNLGLVRVFGPIFRQYSFIYSAFPFFRPYY